MESFIKERLNSNEKSCCDTLPQTKLQTFAKLTAKKSVKSTTDKLQAIKADRELFGRFIIVAKSRDVNLLLYERESLLFPFPWLNQMGHWEKQKECLTWWVGEEHWCFLKAPPPDRDHSTGYVMDGMATVQMVKTGGASTFGTLAEKYWEIFTAPLHEQHCKRVDTGQFLIVMTEKIPLKAGSVLSEGLR